RRGSGRRVDPSAHAISAPCSKLSPGIQALYADLTHRRRMFGCWPKGDNEVKRAVAIVFMLVFAVPGAALAQTEETTPPTTPDELTILTPYPAVAVEPGDQITFDLTISAPD